MIENDTMHERWFEEAGRVAQGALCLKDKCGTVIVAGNEMISRGYNAPPLDDPASRTCLETFDLTKKPKFDISCCVHAEWRAILDALRQNPDRVQGASLYFMRLDEAGKLTRAGEPYCTVCSRLALDAGIATFYLWHEDGIRGYPTREYNQRSYDFFRLPADVVR